MTTPRLNEASAERYARLALACVRREFPCQPGHVVASPADVQTPRALHPAFYGCFDWHSAVHAHWLLARLLRRFPVLAAAADIRAALNENLAPAHLRQEAEYLRAHPSFERPYGWAWLLQLARELSIANAGADARAWAAAVQPLADEVVQRFLAFLPKLEHPIRSGVHSNTAFGLAFAWDYAQTAGRHELTALVQSRARAYYGGDQDYPWRWEPGGSDFFSPTLVEADLMRRVLPADEFAAWLTGLLPGWRGRIPLEPVSPADRSDGQLVHLDGLNLSRAWCLWNIAAGLPPADERRLALAVGAQLHAAAGLAHVASGDYMGEHWLATFAVYALECAPGTAA